MEIFGGRGSRLAVSLLIATALVWAQASPALTVGVYDWGGTSTASISEGVEQIAQMGGRIARISLSSRMNIDYNISSSCIPNFSLAQAVQYPDVKKAFENPDINVFMLTAYDGVTFPDCVSHLYLQPSTFTWATQAAVVQEYSDLTFYLYTTYANTNKRFILSNWESDNDVYCGQSYEYAVDATFRASCNASYPQVYGGNPNPSVSFDGLKYWLQLRQQGIEDGRNRALMKRVGGMRVYSAPEFCIVRTLHDAGFESTLYDILPYVKFDYVSYSSYQSMGETDPGDALLQDLNTIQTVVGSDAVIIGEIMTATPGADPTVFIQTLEGALNDALAWGVPYVIYWNLYSASACPVCGIFDTSGNLTQVGAFFESYLNGPDSCTVDNAARPQVRKQRTGH